MFLWVFYGLLVRNTRKKSGFNQRKTAVLEVMCHYSLLSIRFTEKYLSGSSSVEEELTAGQSEIKLWVLRAVNTFALPEASK